MQKVKTSFNNTTRKVKNKYNKEMNERKVKNAELLRQRTETYRFKVIKKMKNLYDLCLDKTYDSDLRNIYVTTLNNILMKKIKSINSTIEVVFTFTMNQQQEEDQFVNSFAVFVMNCINNYNLEELKVINHYVTKFLN